MCDDYDDEYQEYEYDNSINEDCYDADFLEDDRDEYACDDDSAYHDDDDYNNDYDTDNDYDYENNTDNEYINEDNYIPTYDELDLEGRYYLYGSRSEYNKWRNEQIGTMRSGSYRGNSAYSGNSGCMVTLVLFVIIFIIPLFNEILLFYRYQIRKHTYTILINRCN